MFRLIRRPSSSGRLRSTIPTTVSGSTTRRRMPTYPLATKVCGRIRTALSISMSVPLPRRATKRIGCRPIPERHGSPISVSTARSSPISIEAGSCPISRWLADVRARRSDLRRCLARHLAGALSARACEHLTSASTGCRGQHGDRSCRSDRNGATRRRSWRPPSVATY